MHTLGIRWLPIKTIMCYKADLSLRGGPYIVIFTVPLPKALPMISHNCAGPFSEKLGYKAKSRYVPVSL